MDNLELKTELWEQLDEQDAEVISGGSNFIISGDPDFIISGGIDFIKPTTASRFGFSQSASTTGKIRGTLLLT